MPASQESQQGCADDGTRRQERGPDDYAAPPPAKNVSKMEHEEVEIYAEKSIKLRTGGGCVLWLAEDNTVLLTNKTGAQVNIGSDGSIMMMNATQSMVRIDAAGIIEVTVGQTKVQIAPGLILVSAGGMLTLDTGGTLTATAAMVTVNAPMTAFSGTVTGLLFNGHP